MAWGDGTRGTGRRDGTGVRGERGPVWHGGDHGGPAAGTPDDPPGLPPTTRIGPRGGAGRGLQLAVGVVLVGLAVAVLKPWAWNAPPPPVPGSGLGSPAAVGAAVPTPTPAPTPADPLTRSACLVDPIWTTVVDQVAEATSTRSWTRLDPVPAAGPTDPAIATVRVFADAVPRIGFCDPAGVEASPSDGIVADPSPANGAGQVPLGVRVWLVTPAPAPLTALATEIRPELLSGGTVADRGALFGPPASAASGARGAASPAAWPTGRYVFRVDLPGAGPAGSDVTWFAVDLKGPWPWGPGTPRAIAPVVGPGLDPAPSTLASAAPGASGGASPRPSSRPGRRGGRGRSDTGAATRNGTTATPGDCRACRRPRR